MMSRQLLLIFFILLLYIPFIFACVSPPNPFTSDLIVSSSDSLCRDSYDLNGFSIKITGDNVVFDCNQSILFNSPLFINISGRSGVALKNCYFVLDNGQKAVELSNSNNVNFTDIYANVSTSSTSNFVFDIYSSRNVYLQNIYANDSEFGVRASDSENIVANSSTVKGIWRTAFSFSNVSNISLVNIDGENLGTFFSFDGYSGRIYHTFFFSNISLENVANGLSAVEPLFDTYTIRNITLKDIYIDPNVLGRGIYWDVKRVTADWIEFDNVWILDGFDGIFMYFGGVGAGVVNDTLSCFNSNIDVGGPSLGDPPLSVVSLVCDKSNTVPSPCTASCAQQILVPSITPSIPTPSDTIQCTAFADGLFSQNVTFKFYINGVYDPAYDETVVNCVPGSLCSSSPIGPFPAGTQIFCSAQGVYRFGTTETFYSSVIYVRDLPEPGEDTDNIETQFNTLPFSVSQACENNQVKFTFVSMPDTRINIYNDVTGDLLDFKITGGDGLAYYYTEENVRLRFEAVKDKYYNEERVLEPIECTNFCESSSDCSDNEVCSGNRCVPLECGYCQIAKFNTCINLECCKDFDCGSGFSCVNNSCIPLECREGEVLVGNKCMPETEKPALEDLLNERFDSLDSDVAKLFRRLGRLEENLSGVRGNVEELNNEVALLKERKFEIPWWLIALTLLSVFVAFYVYYRLYRHEKK